MCIIVFAYQVLDDYPLVLLANRDEHLNRPSDTAHTWPGNAQIVAGRDQIGGGTWLGYNRFGQWAALTNFRQANVAQKDKRSRGLILTDFLATQQSAPEFCESLLPSLALYDPFNLLIADNNQLFYLSSQQQSYRSLAPGYYGLSNADLDTPWPKIVKLKQHFQQQIASNIEAENLWPMMQDTTLANTSQLPATGITHELEHALSAIYIDLPDYGTRCSTLLTINKQQRFNLQEKQYA